MVLRSCSFAFVVVKTSSHLTVFMSECECSTGAVFFDWWLDIMIFLTSVNRFSRKRGYYVLRHRVRCFLRSGSADRKKMSRTRPKPKISLVFFSSFDLSRISKGEGMLKVWNNLAASALKLISVYIDFGVWFWNRFWLMSTCFNVILAPKTPSRNMCKFIRIWIHFFAPDSPLSYDFREN